MNKICSDGRYEYMECWRAGIPEPCDECLKEQARREALRTEQNRQLAKPSQWRCGYEKSA